MRKKLKKFKYTVHITRNTVIVVVDGIKIIIKYILYFYNFEM